MAKDERLAVSQAIKRFALFGAYQMTKKKWDAKGGKVVIKSTDGEVLNFGNAQISVDGHVLENVRSIHFDARAGQITDVTIQIAASEVVVQNANVVEARKDLRGIGPFVAAAERAQQSALSPGTHTDDDALYDQDASDC